MTNDLMRRWRANIEDARQLARESARATRVMPGGRSDRRWTALVAILAAAAAAFAMYLLDPALGRRRRTMLADRSAAAWRDAGVQADRARRLAAGRLGAMAQEAMHLGTQPMPNDASLAAKVETALFRDPSVPKGNININVEERRVVLRGEVQSERQRTALARKAKRVSGVAEVENLLHLPGEPAVAAKR